MAQTKTVLQMLGFAFGESEVSFASRSVRIYNSSFGGGGRAVYGWVHGLSCWTDRLEKGPLSWRITLWNETTRLLLLTKLATSMMLSSTGWVQSTMNCSCSFFFVFGRFFFRWWKYRQGQWKADFFTLEDNLGSTTQDPTSLGTQFFVFKEKRLLMVFGVSNFVLKLQIWNTAS